MIDKLGRRAKELIMVCFSILLQHLLNSLKKMKCWMQQISVVSYNKSDLCGTMNMERWKETVVYFTFFFFSSPIYLEEGADSGIGLQGSSRCGLCAGLYLMWFHEYNCTVICLKYATLTFTACASYRLGRLLNISVLP